MIHSFTSNFFCGVCRFIFFVTLVFHAESAKAQLSSWYEPGVAVSSGLNFSGNMAEESAVWFRNAVRFTSGETSPGFFCVNLGYAHRSYLLDYYSPVLESSSSGNVYRNAFVLQLGAECRLRNIRKLRKVLQPFAGVYFQRHFYKVSEDVQEARAHFKLDGYEIALRQVVFEIGSEVVSAKWPRFFFSFQIEPTFLTTQFGSEGNVLITDKLTSETQTVDIFYKHKEYPCARLFLGVRF